MSAHNIIQLMHSIEVYIGICQPNEVMFQVDKS